MSFKVAFIFIRLLKYDFHELFGVGKKLKSINFMLQKSEAVKTNNAMVIPLICGQLPLQRLTKCAHGHSGQT